MSRRTIPFTENTPPPRRLMGLPACVMTAALLLGACGTDDESTTSGAETTVVVPGTTVEERYVPTTLEAPAGDSIAATPDLDGDLEAQLFDAVQTDDTAAIVTLAEAGADLETTSPSGLTPFQLAVKAQKPEIAIALIDAGADVLAPTPPIQQPVFYDALGFGYIDIVDAMIEAGADVNQVEENTMITPMMRAVESGDLDLIRSIADLGAALDSTDSSDDGLYSWAFFFGHDLEVVELLYELGVDPTYANSVGRSVLQDAERRSSPEIVEFLASVQP